MKRKRKRFLKARIKRKEGKRYNVDTVINFKDGITQCIDEKYKNEVIKGEYIRRTRI